MSKKILMLIDCQIDFISGSLAVKDAKETMDGLCDFIIENGKSYDKIILTADWHPTTHCSFQDNGGMWPKHCVQHSVGASIYQPLLEALDKINSDYVVLTKGDNEDREEYSVFKNEKSCKEIKAICETLGTEHMDYVGIALDYCVKDSILDCKRELPNMNIHLFPQFSPCIGDKDATLAKLEESNVDIMR